MYMYIDVFMDFDFSLVFGPSLNPMATCNSCTVHSIIGAHFVDVDWYTFHLLMHTCICTAFYSVLSLLLFFFPPRFRNCVVLSSIHNDIIIIMIIG